MKALLLSILIITTSLLSSCGTLTYKPTHQRVRTSPSAYEMYQDKQLKREQLRYYKNANIKLK